MMAGWGAMVEPIITLGGGRIVMPLSVCVFVCVFVCLSVFSQNFKCNISAIFNRIDTWHTYYVWCKMGLTNIFILGQRSRFHVKNIWPYLGNMVVEIIGVKMWNIIPTTFVFGILVYAL